MRSTLIIKKKEEEEIRPQDSSLIRDSLFV